MSTASSNPTHSSTNSSTGHQPNQNGSSNSGQTRFRGDVPSFSPSNQHQANPSPSINHQSMHLPHQPYVQQFYHPPPAAAAGGAVAANGSPTPFVYGNHFLNYYSMYPPASFDYPMYTQYQYYPIPTPQFNNQQQFNHMNGVAGGYNNSNLNPNSGNNYNNSNNYSNRTKPAHKHNNKTNGAPNNNRSTQNKSPHYTNQTYQQHQPQYQQQAQQHYPQFQHQQHQHQHQQHQQNQQHQHSQTQHFQNQPTNQYLNSSHQSYQQMPQPHIQYPQAPQEYPASHPEGSNQDANKTSNITPLSDPTNDANNEHHNANDSNSTAPDSKSNNNDNDYDNDEKQSHPSTSDPSHSVVSPTISKQSPPDSEVNSQQANSATPRISTSNADQTQATPPLFFNSDATSFKENQVDVESQRKVLFDSKLGSLNSYIETQNLKNNEEHNVLLYNKDVKIIDLNSNIEFYKNVPLIFNARIGDTGPVGNASETASKNNSPAIPATNWAAVLQSTAAKKSIGNTTSSSRAKQPGATGHQRQSSSDLTASNSGSSRSLEKESSQPLGILILKIMYDPIYSNLNNYPAFKIKPRGLTNTGNICYMNAILQVLLYCEPLNKILKLIDDKAIGSLSQKSTTPLLDLTLNFFKDFLNDGKAATNGSIKSLSPENFYMSLITHEKFQHLKWGQQEDAEEFLGYFLDGLHEEFVTSIGSLSTSQIDALIQSYQSILTDQVQFSELKLSIKNAVKIIKRSKSEKQSEVKEEISNLDDDDEADQNDGWSEVGSNNKKVSAKRTVEIEPSPISNIFGGQFRSVLNIPKHKESQSITLDPFQCVQLDISDEHINTVEDAFLKLNEPESIPYKSSQNKEVIAKKQTFFDQLPNVLIIHLKRFSYQHKVKNDTDGADADLKSTFSGTSALGSIEKLRKKITYNHTLDIPQECFSSVVLKQQHAQPAKHYKLTGVIYHHGTSTEGGHYTCDVLRKSSVFDNEDESGGKSNDNEWIRIDDTSIKVMDREDVLNGGAEESTKTAYILLYQRV